MQPRVDEISDGVYRISTCVPEIAGGFTFNQFVVKAPEPLLFHAGMRQLFPLVSEAVASVIDIETLRWVSFAHVEADECGALNSFLAAAPQAQALHGNLGVMLSVNDLSDRPARGLEDGETLALGDGYAVRELATPHVPHNWESHLLFEERTRTLFCGDLGTQVGDGPAVTDADLLDAAVMAEEIFGQTSRSAAVPATLRRLADLEPTTLAMMHGSSYNGDCPGFLRSLADIYERQFGCVTAVPAPAVSV